MQKLATIPVNTLSVLLASPPFNPEAGHEEGQAYETGSRAEEAANAVHVKNIFTKTFNVAKFGLQVLVTIGYDPEEEGEAPYYLKLQTCYREGQASVADIISFADRQERNEEFWLVDDDRALKFLEDKNTLFPLAV